MENEFNKRHEYFDSPNKSYSSNIQSWLDVYDKRFNELMEFSKEDLIRMLIGDRPVCGPMSYFVSDSTATPFESHYA